MADTSERPLTSLDWRVARLHQRRAIRKWHRAFTPQERDAICRMIESGVLRG